MISPRLLCRALHNISSALKVSGNNRTKTLTRSAPFLRPAPVRLPPHSITIKSPNQNRP